MPSDLPPDPPDPPESGPLLSKVSTVSLPALSNVPPAAASGPDTVRCVPVSSRLGVQVGVFEVVEERLLSALGFEIGFRWVPLVEVDTEAGSKVKPCGRKIHSRVQGPGVQKTRVSGLRSWVWEYRLSVFGSKFQSLGLGYQCGRS